MSEERASGLRYSRQVWGIFGLQAGERFAFYGMLSVLVLFLVAPIDEGGAALPSNVAVAITGTAAGAVYVLTLAAGWVADRLLGPQRMVAVGLLVATAGYAALALPGLATIWVGIGLALVGVSMVVPNVSALLAAEFPDTQAARDSAFSSLYVAINVGAFLSPLITGAIALAGDWNAAFAVTTLGTVTAFSIFLWIRPRLNPAGRAPTVPPTRQLVSRFLKWTGAALGLVVVAAVVDLLTPSTSGIETIATATLLALAMPVVFLWRLARDRALDATQRDRVKAYAWLFGAATAFWFMYGQKTGVITLMADQSVDRTINGWAFPASWFQSLDPVLVIILGPLFAIMWTRLGSKAPATPHKYALAMFFMACTYAGLALLTGSIGSGVLVAWGWVVVVYVGMSVAELLLAPAGSSATTRLAPPGRESQLLAVWYLSIGAGYGLTGLFGGLQTSVGYPRYFLAIAVISAVVGLLLVLVAPRILRGMHGLR